MRHVALTIRGRYLRVCPFGEGRRVYGDGATIDADAIFERIALPHDRIALRTLEGRYLALRPDQGHNFGLYPEGDLTPHAVFEEILWPDGQISLRSCELTFVSQASDSDPVVANRVEAGASERFHYVVVPVPMIPTQRTGEESSDLLKRSRTGR